MDTYEVIFDGNKLVIEADVVIDIGTRVTFYNGEEQVAKFVIAFGSSFGYSKKASDNV